MIRLKSIAVLGAACATSLVLAAPVTYAGRRQAINVGVLVLDSQQVGGQPANVAPHVWGQLDKDRSVKPAAWSFTNPRALSILTDFARDRWVARGATGVPVVGSRLTKDDGPYWEVDLEQVNDSQLSDYDALLLVANGTIRLNPRDREKLRRFVDQGGILWVDTTTSTSAVFEITNPLPLPLTLGSSTGSLLLDPNHPLLSSPNAVSANEVGSLFNNGSLTLQVPGVAPQGQGWVVIDGLKMDPVVGPSPADMTLAVGRIGDGFLVASTRFISQALNQGRRPNGTIDPVNDDFRSLPAVFGPAYRTAAKIVVNMISLRSNASTEIGNGRKTGSIGADISAPLLKRFETSQVVPAQGTSPIVYKGRIIMTDRTGRLVVLDAAPATDRDGDGNPDDGLVDPPGSPIDVLWQSDRLSGALSGPTATEVVRANDNSDGFDVVLIQEIEDGSPARLHQFNLNSSGDSIAPARTYQSGNNATVNGVNSAQVPQRPPAPPTVHEGMVYVTGIPQANNSLGRVWIVDLIRQTRMESGGRPWQVELAPRLPAVDGAATVGYIPIQDNSGGVDKVVYVPTQPDGLRSAGFTSLWFGARGEAPVAVQRSGSTLTLTTRASLQNLPIFDGAGQPSLSVKLSVVNPATGRPYSDAQMAGMFSGAPVLNAAQNGSIQIGLGGFGAGLDFGPAGDAAIRVDYTLDWGRSGTGPGSAAPDNYVRGDAQLPDEAGNRRRVLGGIALAANGNIFVVTAPYDAAAPGGSLFALRERGRGDFDMLYRWEAFDQITLLTSGGSGIQRLPYDGAVIDYDGLLSFPGFGAFLNRPMTIQKFATGPVVRGNRVYAALASGKALPFPGAANTRFTTTVVAFDADPRPLEMIVEGLGLNFALLQPDPGRSIRPPTGAFEPNVLSVLQPAQFQAETVGSFTRVTLNSVASVSRGRFRDAIINNLPIIARRAGAPDVVIQPDSGFVDGTFVPGNADGRWNPQRWQIVINGMEVTGNLFISGDTLYFGGGSFLPGFLNNGFTTAPVKQGFLYAMDLRVGAADAREPVARQSWMVGPLRPWERYLSVLDPEPSGGGVIPSPYLIWPSAFGIRSFDDFRIRVNQAVIGDPGAPESVSGLIGGGDVLVPWDSSQSYGFSRSDFMVVDEGRMVRIDSSGFPLWSAEGTIRGGAQGDVGSSVTQQRFSRPSRAYTVGGNDYLIADPGNNRIVRVDAGGRETRTINSFRLDPVFLPPGVPDNVSVKLSGPRDVITFTTRRSDAEINTLVANNELSRSWARNLPGTAEFWVHYLIADTGNQRVIEIVDRYEFDASRGVVGAVIRYDDPTSDAPPVTIAGQPRRLEPALGLLRWQIRSELTRKQYSYNSIDRQWVTDASGTRPVYLFGFGNVEPSRSSFGLSDQPGRTDNQVGAGGAVLYDPATGASDVLTEYSVPAIPNSVFWNDLTANFGVAPERNRYLNGGVRKISGLRSATLSYAGGSLAVMITDSNGVFELVPSGGAWQVRWMLPREAYLVMRRTRGGGSGPVLPTTKNPMGFLPNYARRLNSGEVLVVNGYVGEHRAASLPHVPAFGISPGDPFGGEVVILDGSINSNPSIRGFDWNKPNLGFDSFYVNFELPPVSGTRGLQGPVFAEKR